MSVNANILTLTIYSLCLKEHSRARQVSSAWIASSSWMLHHQSCQVSAPWKSSPAGMGSPWCLDQPVTPTWIALMAAMRTQPHAVSESHCFTGTPCWGLLWNLNSSVNKSLWIHVHITNHYLLQWFLIARKNILNLCGFLSPEYLMMYRLVWLL